MGMIRLSIGWPRHTYTTVSDNGCPLNDTGFRHSVKQAVAYCGDALFLIFGSRIDVLPQAALRRQRCAECEFATLFVLYSRTAVYDCF